MLNSSTTFKLSDKWIKVSGDAGQGAEGGDAQADDSAAAGKHRAVNIKTCGRILNHRQTVLSH